MEIENIIDRLSQIEKEQTLSFSIEVLDLSIRVRHALLRNGINTVGDLVKKWVMVPHVRNMGAKGIGEITEKLNLWYQMGGMLSLVDVPALPLDVSALPLGDPAIDEGLSGDQAINERPSWYNESFSNVPVEMLDLPTRAYNVLKRNNINTIDQIYTEWQSIGSSKNVGPTTLELIQMALVSFQSSDNNQKAFYATTSLEVGSQEVGIESSPFAPNCNHPLKVSISELGLQSNTYKILLDNNIETIDQISPYKLREISSSEDISLDKIRQINKALRLWLDQDEKRKNAYLEAQKRKEISFQPEIISFEDYINAIFKVLKPHARSIIEIRYGLITGKKATLQETAEHFGVTRERIRQIEKGGMLKINSRLSSMTQSPLLEKIEGCIINRGGLISDSRLIEQLKSTFVGTDFQSVAILEFLIGMLDKDGEIAIHSCKHRVVYILELDGWSTNFWDKDQILLAANKILELLSSAPSPLQWTELFSVLVREDGLLTLDENLAHAIALCMSDTQQIQRQMDGCWFKNEKASRYSRLISVMKQIGQPAHFSEIAEFYSRTYPDKPLSEHNVHAVISGREEFVRVGRGKYGLAEWGMHDDGNISNAVRRILANHNYPMPLTDIVDEVLKTWDVEKSSVIAAIDIDARFSKTKDGNIWLTETGLTLKRTKKRDDDTRCDRLLVVLREIGQPSHIQLIVETHNKSYPERPFTILSAKSIMFRNTNFFIRTGHDVFGLVEWGVEPSKEISSIDRKNGILEIIKEQNLIRSDVLLALYNQRYSDLPISKNTLYMYLGKLKGIIFSPNKGEYQLADQSGISHQVIAPVRRDMTWGGKLAAAIKDIGSPAHIDDIVVVYKRLFPNDNKEYDEIRWALYNNRKTLVSFGAGVFGLPGWEASQNVSRHSEPKSEKEELSPQIDDRFEKILKIVSEQNHPSVTSILERYNQLNPEDQMTVKGFMEYLMYVKNNPEKYPIGLVN